MMTEHNYQSSYKKIMYGMSSREIPVDNIINAYAQSFVLMFPYENVNSNFSYLSSTTTTHYLPDGSEGAKTTNQYVYDNQDHLQLTSEITDEGNRHKTIKKYKYPA